MRFRTNDVIAKRELESEIMASDASTIHHFVQTWVPDYLMRILKNPKFDYAFFEWDKIIKASFTVAFGYRCFAVLTEGRLDGLLCLKLNGRLRIEFIATAPWNYSTEGKVRGIGRGLVYYVIMTSQYSGLGGEFYLTALPKAEEFYTKIGMAPTGNVNKTNLKEFEMSKAQAQKFTKNFKKDLVEN